MLAALALPRILDRFADRTVMVGAALLLAALTLAHAIFMLSSGLLAWMMFLFAWAASGTLYSAILTPSGRLLRRSSLAEDQPALFAAQFALSHACWLVTYPVAGWAGEVLGLATAMLILGGLAALGAVLALRVWPAADPTEIEHDHPDLSPDHPHFRDHGMARHRHAFVIDDEHHAWPSNG